VADPFDQAVNAHRAGKLEAAIDGYRKVLKRAPGHAGALANLASVLKQAGRRDEALAVYQRAVAAKGAGGEVWFNYGNLLRDGSDVAEAEAAYRKALGLGLAQARVNLAIMLEKQGRKAYDARQLAEAEALFRRAHEADGKRTDTLIGLGVVLKDLGRRDEAIGCWKRVLELEPRNSSAHNNLGALYRMMRKPKEAEHHLRTALEIAPGDTMAAANLAHVILELGQTSEALGLARGILERAPDSPDGHLMLGFALAYQAEVDAAVDAFLECHKRKPEANVALSNALFASLYSARPDEAVLELHKDLGARIVAPRPARTSWPNSREAQRKLRVGYLSPDLRKHPVSAFFEPVLSNHSAVAAYCYSTTAAPDAATERLKTKAGAWRDCSGMPDEGICEAIERDGIDILVDLAGHTAQNRAGVFRAKPAPVQVMYIGYPGTSGLPEMDYVIVDEHICPPGSEHLYTEQVVRLPGSFWCFRPPDDAPEVAPLPARRNGFVTFGSYNALQKMQPAAVALWVAVLRAVPGSRLVLKSLPFADKDLRESVRRRFIEAGVAGERLDVLPPSEPAAFLAEYGRIDIALDPVPYNGGTTTCEALWMGVPVITLSGQRFCARMGASILAQVGLADLVATDPATYVAAAARLAADPDLGALREKLRSLMRVSPLCDGVRVARALESAYRNIWGRWLDAR
jgi:predicted O-linked N-acetylglucosamine transferase (SPINDLY family)